MFILATSCMGGRFGGWVCVYRGYRGACVSTSNQHREVEQRSATALRRRQATGALGKRQVTEVTLLSHQHHQPSSTNLRVSTHKCTTLRQERQGCKGEAEGRLGDETLGLRTGRPLTRVLDVWVCATGEACVLVPWSSQSRCRSTAAHVSAIQPHTKAAS